MAFEGFRHLCAHAQISTHFDEQGRYGHKHNCQRRNRIFENGGVERMRYNTRQLRQEIAKPAFSFISGQLQLHARRHRISKSIRLEIAGGHQRYQGVTKQPSVSCYTTRRYPEIRVSHSK